jgi:hypothetical protein
MNRKNYEFKNVALSRPGQAVTAVCQWMKTASMLLAILILTAGAHAQCAVEGFDPTPNPPVYSGVVQPDGNFSTLAPTPAPPTHPVSEPFTPQFGPAPK